MDKKRGSALLAVAAMVFAACSGAATPAPSAAPVGGGALDRDVGGAESQAPASAAAAAATVRLQLQWAPQAQFAGYFAADKQGYYKAENLTVTMVPGGADVVPQQVGSAADGPEFTISWVPKVLEARESGSDLVDIAQVFQRSGTLSVTWKKDDDQRPVQARRQEGRRLGLRQRVRGHGRLLTCGLTPGLENNGDPTKQYQKVIQAFNMKPVLAHEISAAEAMIYNEYAQVLEATNPETGELYTARRPERHQLERLPRRDAPGRDLRPQGVARPGHATRTSPSASSGPRSRAGSTAATIRTTASSTRRTPAASSAPGTRSG